MCHCWRDLLGQTVFIASCKFYSSLNDSALFGTLKTLKLPFRLSLVCRNLITTILSSKKKSLRHAITYNIYCDYFIILQ